MASPSSRIAELAAAIHLNTEKLDKFYQDNGLQTPSFGAERPQSNGLSLEYDMLRQKIADDTMELHELVSEPREQFYSFAHGSKILTSLHAIYHYKIPSVVPSGKAISFQEIARATNLNEPDVRRILRLAASYHIFEEDDQGLVRHTATSKLLADDPQMQDWLGTLCEEIWPAATQVVPAMAKWPNSSEANHSGYCIAHNTTEPIYQYIQKHPERAKRFAGSMAEYTNGPAFSFKHVVDGFDWGSLREATIVDIGGSHGEVFIPVAERFPELRIIIEDLPSVIETRPSDAVPPKLRDRIEFVPHDMFAEQPVSNADVYFFRWIFHGWADKYCISLLRNLIPALKPGAKILLNDFCLPEPNMLPKMMERTIRVMDIAQLALQNSRERYVHEYKELFAEADSRFKFVRVIHPPGSALSIVEAEWAG